MTYYRWAWRTCWAGPTLLLGLLGLTTGSVGAVLATGVLAGVIGAVVAAALLQNDGGARVPVALHHRVTARCGVRAALAAGALSAWAAAVGPLVPPLLVAAALTSPPVVTLLLTGHWWRRAPRAESEDPEGAGCRCGCADPVSADQARVLLAPLSEVELARVWRHSLPWLHRARSATEWSGLVALRTACLDEMQARDPAAVRRWLGSHPPVATAPDLSRPTEGPTIPVVPPSEQ